MKLPLLLLELLSGSIHSARSFLMEMVTRKMERASRIHGVVGEYSAHGMWFGIAFVDEVAERRIGFAEFDLSSKGGKM